MSKYKLDVIDEDKRNSGIPKGRKRTWMGGEAEEEHKCKPVCAGLREPFQIGSKDGMKKFLLFMRNGVLDYYFNLKTTGIV